MKRLIVFSLLLSAGLASAVAVDAQKDPTAIDILKVANNLYVVTGGRGTGASSNTISGCTTVFITSAGVVLIDTKLPGFAGAILDKVKSVTPKPVTTIVNTHSHGDHTGGNIEFPRTVEVVTHYNTSVNMSRMDAFKGPNGDRLPRKTFKDRVTLGSGPDTMDLFYFGRGHTNGDAVIVLPALRIAVFGDLFARKFAPIVDAGNGGSAVEYPQTLAKAIAGIKNVDSIITGHSSRTIRGTGTFELFGPVVTWAELQEYQDFMREFVASAQASMKAGRTIDQAVAEMKLPAKYASYDMAQARNDVQLVYEESKP